MVSVIIPAYNESTAIGPTVINVKQVLFDANYENFEIIVVDDGSGDDTAKNAKAAGARVIQHPHNIGYGRALKTGITESKYDTIVITDSDGTYPINEIPSLLHRYIKGFDMVVGARTGNHYRGSAIKWPLRLLLKFLVEWTAGRSIPDINSGLRVFSKKTIISFLPHLCDTFSFTTSLTLAYMMTGRFVGYQNIPYEERIGKSHVKLWSDSFKTLQFIIQAIAYYNPLKLFMLLSIACLLFALISVCIGLIFNISTGFVMGVGAIVCSILIFSMGLLAEILRQILSK
ncbi:glycosyltransferase family 2 protein [Amylibacter sp.]|nr:glycosyltransferase family 2 protein [Amylibacter sp.]